MAAYDLDEQEKLGDLKAWWARFGNFVTAAVLVVALGIAGSQGWKWWTTKQSAEASTLYFALSDAVGKNETAKIKDALAQLLEKFPGTGYAPRGALLGAKAAVDAGDLATAKTQLEWVVANSNEDELKSLAGLFLDMKGDIFNLQGKAADAKTAYEAALAKLDAKGAQRQYTQLKLDALASGTTSAPIPAAPAPAAATAPAAPAAATGAKK